MGVLTGQWRPLGYNASRMDASQLVSQGEPMTPQSLRDVLRFWTTGVAIVSAAREGEMHGMTVNSFTSLSLEPPLVLVSLEQQTRTHGFVQAAGAYAVSLLRQEQKALADLFAGREGGEVDRFEGVDTLVAETGSPILADGMAFFDCRVTGAHQAGTHTVFIGEVLAAGILPGAGGEADPLVYFNRNYRKLSE